MNKEEILAEIISLLEFINHTKEEIGLEHDKFQVALVNTLRLLDDSSSILTKMKGNVENLKAYLIRTSTDIHQSSLDSYEHMRTRVDKIRNLVQTS